MLIGTGIGLTEDRAYSCYLSHAESITGCELSPALLHISHHKLLSQHAALR